MIHLNVDTGEKKMLSTIYFCAQRRCSEAFIVSILQEEMSDTSIETMAQQGDTVAVILENGVRHALLRSSSFSLALTLETFQGKAMTHNAGEFTVASPKRK